MNLLNVVVVLFFIIFSVLYSKQEKEYRMLYRMYRKNIQNVYRISSWRQLVTSAVSCSSWQSELQQYDEVGEADAEHAGEGGAADLEVPEARERSAVSYVLKDVQYLPPLEWVNREDCE